MNIKKLLVCLFNIVFVLIGISICLMGFNENIMVYMSIIISVIALLSSIYITKDIFNIVNAFMVFMIMYGLSGPIEIIKNGYIGEIFTPIYMIVPYIIIYNLCIAALIIGITLSYRASNKKEVNISNFDLILTIKISILLAMITSFMAILDFIRAGGISVLLQGRAVYMQALSRLPLTLPTNDIAKLSFVIFISSISIAKNRGLKLNYKLNFIKIFILLSPYITILIISGSRMSLVAFIFIGIMGYSYLNPSIRIKKIYIICIIIGYLLMGFIYMNRGYIPHAISTGDWSKVFENMSNKELIIESLSPGTNEFSVGFGNFNEYYISNKKNLRLGSSYIKDLNVMIPGFLYPGEKHKTITYEFRDEFFYEESKRSSIAGTGFSAMLEAYMNFGYLGMPLIYMIFGFIIGKLEIKRRISSSYVYMLAYLIIFQSVTMTFHRTQLANIISEIMYPIIFIFIYKCVFIVLKNIKLKYYRKNIINYSI